MRYELRVHVVTPDYKYWNVLGVFASVDTAKQRIEKEIAQWPSWSEGRRISFRSHCQIVEV